LNSTVSDHAHNHDHIIEIVHKVNERKKKNNAHLTSLQMKNSIRKLITRKNAERRVSVPEIKQLK